MRKDKNQLEGPPKGIIKVHENEDATLIKNLDNVLTRIRHIKSLTLLIRLCRVIIYGI
jgi:hypothetical protein